mgnify:FL=1
MVYEICDKNSGRIGGKFMERKKHKNLTTGQYYQQKEFMIGKTIYLNSYWFQIVEGDEYTEKYMEDNPEIFPQSNAIYVLNKIKEGASWFANVNEFAIQLVWALDKNGDGQVSMDEMN